MSGRDPRRVTTRVAAAEHRFRGYPLQSHSRSETDLRPGSRSDSVLTEGQPGVRPRSQTCHDASHCGRTSIPRVPPTSLSRSETDLRPGSRSDSARAEREPGPLPRPETRHAVRRSGRTWIPRSLESGAPPPPPPGHCECLGTLVRTYARTYTSQSVPVGRGEGRDLPLPAYADHLRGGPTALGQVWGTPPQSDGGRGSPPLRLPFSRQPAGESRGRRADGTLPRESCRTAPGR